MLVNRAIGILGLALLVSAIGNTNALAVANNDPGVCRHDVVTYFDGTASTASSNIRLREEHLRYIRSHCIVFNSNSVNNTLKEVCKSKGGVAIRLQRWFIPTNGDPAVTVNNDIRYCPELVPENFSCFDWDPVKKVLTFNHDYCDVGPNQ